MVSVLKMRETPIDYIWLLKELEYNVNEFSDYNERRMVHSLFYLAQSIGFFRLFSFTDGIEGPFSSDVATLIPEFPEWKVVWEEWDMSTAHELWPKLNTLITPPEDIDQKAWIRLLGNYVWFYEAKNLGREGSLKTIQSLACGEDMTDVVKNRLKNSLFYLKVQA
jgi:hypothetical protein